MSELIDTYNWTWRSDLIRDTFIVPDADAILNIPLRAGGGEDFLAWDHEQSGVYSVKSAYRSLVIKEEQAALREGTVTSTSESEGQMWTST